MNPLTPEQEKLLDERARKMAMRLSDTMDKTTCNAALKSLIDSPAALLTFFQTCIALNQALDKDQSEECKSMERSLFHAAFGACAFVESVKLAKELRNESKN